MDYFQGVVTEYLRADRAMFVNAECLIQLDDGKLLGKGRHWFCDALAVNFRERKAYLCEVSYSQTLQALLGRLQSWRENWSALRDALCRDSAIPRDWHVQPWVFVPQDRADLLRKKLPPSESAQGMPAVRISFLESVTPWKYRTWDRDDYPEETEPSQVILEVAAEGGSITLYGRRAPSGWVYSLESIDQSALMLGEGQVRGETPTVRSWPEALQLFAGRPWYRLYPLTVHPEFCSAIFGELTKLQASGKSIPDSRLEEWRAICQEASSQ